MKWSSHITKPVRRAVVKSSAYAPGILRFFDSFGRVTVEFTTDSCVGCVFLEKGCLLRIRRVWRDDDPLWAMWAHSSRRLRNCGFSKGEREAVWKDGWLKGAPAPMGPRLSSAQMAEAIKVNQELLAFRGAASENGFAAKYIYDKGLFMRALKVGLIKKAEGHGGWLIIPISVLRAASE